GAECNISKRNFCVMPHGEVYPCRRFGLAIGNILQEPLLKIMESPVLKNIMNGTKKGRCRTCEIIDCRGCPAMAYHSSGDYLAEDSQCYK
ncbi:MAG: SPASM domain-containing protein, partial [Candidatus Firestonebacteria bacterium]